MKNSSFSDNTRVYNQADAVINEGGLISVLNEDNTADAFETEVLLEEITVSGIKTIGTSSFHLDGAIFFFKDMNEEWEGSTCSLTISGGTYQDIIED